MASRLMRAAVVALSLAAACTGPKGDTGNTGSTGAAGQNGTNGSNGSNGSNGTNGTNAVDKGTLSGHVFQLDANGNATTSPAAGAVVSAIPTGSTGVTPVTAIVQADGSYTLTLPIGYFDVTYGADANDGYDKVVLAAVPVTAGVTLTRDAKLPSTVTLQISFKQGATPIVPPPAPMAPNGTPTIYGAGFGTTLGITAAVTGAPAGTTPTFSWSVVAPTGITQPAIALQNGATDTVGFTTPKFDSVVWDPNDSTYNNLTDADFPNVRMPLRHEAVYVPVWVEARLTYQLKVTVKAGNQSKSAMVAVRAAMYSGGAQAARTSDPVPAYIYPVGQPVVFGAPRFPVVNGVRDAGTYNWQITSAPSGSVAALDNPNAQFVSFTPDLEGTYVLTDTMKDGTGTAYPAAADIVPSGFAGPGKVPGFSPVAPYTVKIVAAKYTGWTGSAGATAPIVTCTVCHDDLLVGQGSTSAADYRTSAHMVLFKQGIDGFQTSHYGASCARCHTTGYSEGHTVANNGFDDVAQQTGWTFPTNIPDVGVSGLNSTVCAPNTAPIAGNCLPPALSSLAAISCESCHGPGSLHAGDATKIGATYTSAGCQQCHDGSSHHDKGMLALKSPHFDKELSIDDASLEARGTSTLHCGRCHTAGGYDEYLKQYATNTATNGPNLVVKDVSGNVISGTPTDAQYLDFITRKQMTSAIVEPQGCVTCHEPHTLKLRTETIDAWNGQTPVLPSGFKLIGVGTGSVCMSCHNTRNGLHNDQSVVASFSAPHTPSQTDIFAGQNAYYVTTGRAALSKHAAITDTCVGCHVKIPGTGLGLYDSAGKEYVMSGSNHTFKANLNICAQCHSSYVTGEAVQADVEGGLTDLGNAISAKVTKTMNAFFTANPTATISIWAWDRTSDTTASSTNGAVQVKLGPAGATGVDVTMDQLAAWDFTTEIHGQESLCTTVSGAGIASVKFSTALTRTNVTELCFQLGGATVTIPDSTISVTITTGGAVGTSKFTYAVNGGAVSAATATKSTFAFPGTNTTLKFATGTYVAGDTFTVTAGAAGVVAGGTNTSPAVTISQATLVNPYTSPINRALWNYYLVHGDGSLGIHNPTFVYNVLTGPLAALQ